jgi:hypothetical protein
MDAAPSRRLTQFAFVIRLGRGGALEKRAMPSLKKKVSVPSGINLGLGNTPNSLALVLLGNPCSRSNQQYRPVQSPSLSAKTVTGVRAGPLKVTGLAVESLMLAVADIGCEQPRVYAGLGHMGTLCCRNVRGRQQ